jgi:protease-4
MAKEQKLVDIIAYEDVYHDAIKKSVKSKKREDYNKVSIFDYTKNDHHWVSTDSKNQIAIIYAQEKFKVEKEMSTL